MLGAVIASKILQCGCGRRSRDAIARALAAGLCLAAPRNLPTLAILATLGVLARRAARRRRRRRPG